MWTAACAPAAQHIRPEMAPNLERGSWLWPVSLEMGAGAGCRRRATGWIQGAFKMSTMLVAFDMRYSQSEKLIAIRRMPDS
jgi:hypothetical protein